MTITMNELHDSRAEWPYPALLPHSIKAYPIVQVAPRIGPQRPEVWPPPMAADVAAWKARTSYFPSLGSQIYVHVPFCPFICHFCPLYKVTKASDRTLDRKEEFVRALIEEIEIYGSIPAAAGHRYHAVYFGGGTPTELSPEQLSRILAALRRNFTIGDDAEITLEGVARQMLEPGYLERAFSYGFNRISFGVQSLDPRTRQRIGRGDKVDDYPALITLARSLSRSANVNCEIMAGLPEQTYELFEQDLAGVMSWGTDSLDILYYVHMAGTKLKQLVAKGKRSSPELGGPLLRLRKLTNNIFREAGWHQVTGEVFVRGERDLFVHTSFGGGGNALNSLLALGPSGFGQLGGTVYHNVCDLDRYLESVRRRLLPVNTAQTLDLATAQRRALLMALLRLEIPEFLLEEGVGRRLASRWSLLGLIERVPGGHRLTERGALWYNHMQMEAMPAWEMLKIARMFGSIEEQRRSLAGDGDASSQSRELLEMVRAQDNMGRVAEWAYQAFLRVHKLPFFDQRAIGFTGAIDA